MELPMLYVEWENEGNKSRKKAAMSVYLQVPKKWRRQEGTETSGSLTRRQFPPNTCLLE